MRTQEEVARVCTTMERNLSALKKPWPAATKKQRASRIAEANRVAAAVVALKWVLEEGNQDSPAV